MANGSPLLKEKDKPRKIKYTQKKCDALLTPIAKKLNPKCLLCGQPTQVGHHFIKKSVSSFLRYYLPNIINLCNACHFRLHFNDEGLWNGKIALKNGQEWLNDLEKNKKNPVRTNTEYYKITFETLSTYLL